MPIVTSRLLLKTLFRNSSDYLMEKPEEPERSHHTGSDVVEWLFHHIEGFQDRREARKYASNLLKAGFIRHTVNKITFSEQCYYVFGDLSDCENCE